MKRDRQIDDAAAEWLGLRDGGLTAAEETRFAAWLRADPRHAAAFARLESASRELDRVIAFRPADAEPDPDLPLVTRPRRRIAWFSATLTAAAAAVAVAYVGWWRPVEHSALAAAADFTRSVVTGVGGVEKILLPDGSVLDLNTDSAATVVFTAAERRVRLNRGEAHFVVAKNPSRPFIVATGGVAVRAVGTAFNVRLHPDAVDVLVTEGKVRVVDAAKGRSLLPASTEATPAGEPLLIAGQRATVFLGANDSRSPQIVAVPPAESAKQLAWQQRKLAFDPAPLGEVVAEFNRYNRHKLVVADAATGALRVGGSFRADDYEVFVRLLESNFDVAVERREDETVLRIRR